MPPQPLVTDGIDTIEGGGGSDTYDASGATSRVLINLGSIPGEVLPNNERPALMLPGQLGLDHRDLRTPREEDGNDTLFWHPKRAQHARGRSPR